MWGCRRLSLIAAPVLGIALLSACTQPPGTIIREKQVLDNGQLVTTDARQRAIISQKPDISTRPGVVVPSNITCVEPQPSVALALANGLGVGVSVFQKGSGALSSAVSEGVFQLDERTIAIQALLNAGYQNCLDYSNGAITNTFYAIRASNLDNLLVTMTLASESAGNLRSTLGSAGTQAAAQAEASQSLIGAVEDIQNQASRLGDARRKTKAASDKLDEEKKSLEEAKGATAKAQEAVDHPPEDADKEELARTLGTKKGEQDAAEKRVAAAQGEYDAARQEQEDLESALSSKIDAATEATATARAKGAGGPSGRPTDTAVLTMGEMQRRFIERSTASQNITACLVELGLASAPPNPNQATYEREWWESMKGQTGNSQSGESGGVANMDPSIFMIISRSERDSKLATFCSQELPMIVNRAQASEQELALERVKNERLNTAVLLLEALTKRSDQCDHLMGENDADTKRRQADCRRQVEGMQQFIQRQIM